MKAPSPFRTVFPARLATRRRRVCDASLTGSAVLLVLLCGCSPKPAATPASPEVKPVPVTVASVRQVNLRRAVTAVGTLCAHEDVLIAPKADGRVLRVLKNEGDEAYPGEVLLELDPTDALLAVAQARAALDAELRKLQLAALPASDREFAEHLPTVPTVAQAAANLELATKEAARFEEEARRGVGSGANLDAARAKVKVAKAAADLAETEARVTLANARRLQTAVAEADERLRETKVYAPVPDDWAAWAAAVGPAANPVRYSVAARMVSKGATISPQRVTNAYRLITDHVLKLRVPVPERYRPLARVGQAADVRVEAYPGVVFPGRVARLFPTVDPEGRTFVAEVEVPNTDRRLKAGGFATADIVTDAAATVLTVPPTAVVAFAGVTKVYVADGPVARAVEVEVGTREKDWVEVRGDLKPGAKVVTSGLSQLVDGSPIRVR
ncbi:MAG: hypothetical protein C0501_05940 [Isosphaera sp.]|nr:hypothetical protein [Isosphaera sp.]